MSHTTNIGPGKDAPEEVNVIIEIQKGSRNKYEMDKETGLLTLDRVNGTNLVYPTDYGYIPGTLGEDGDPIDVLLVCEESILPGVLVKARPVGVFYMVDDDEPDEKIICVVGDDVSSDHIKELSDLGDNFKQVNEHFYLHYKDFKKNWSGGGLVKSNGWGNAAEAREVIKKSIEAAKQFMKKIVPVNATLIPEQAERVFKGVIYDVYHWQQEMYDGTFETFEMLKSTDIVKVLAVVDNKTLIQHETQPGVGSFIDIPGGRNDKPGESDLAAAQREVLEETGLTFKDWKLIRVWQPALKTENFIYLYVASNVVGEAEVEHDNGEKITSELVSFNEYQSLGQAGKLRSWPTFVGEVSSIDELLGLPEFKGKEIER